MKRLLPFLPMCFARLWGTFAFILIGLTALAQRPFVTTWKTDAPNESITIPVNDDVSGYNYVVDWGDSNTSTGQTGDATHTYATAGTYTVSISESFPAIRLQRFGNEVSDKLMSIEQWGDIAWQSMYGAFSGARYMVLNATDVPDLSDVSTLARMFDRAELVNGDLSGWNVSGITDMSGMFNGASSFNGNISGWNVGNVTDMSWMFWGASVFNQDIGAWNVGNVEDMSYMFYQAPVFNQDLSGWNVSRVTTMNSMFFIALDFDQSLGSWDISNVTDMDDMLLATGLSSANYGATLVGWAPQNVQSGIVLNATGQEYCPGTPAETARQQLISKGWTINDDGVAADCSGGGTDGAFITTWQTTNAGISGNDEINIPTSGSGYNYDVYWEKVDDINVNGTETGINGDLTITFPSPGIYRVTITGDFPRIYFNNEGDKDKILTVDQWGDIVWESMAYAFYGARNLQVTTTEAPNLSQVSNLNSMFRNTESFNQDLSSWDVSGVSSAYEMFAGAKAFNGSLAGWEPGAALTNGCDLGGMFRETEVFNQDLSSWDVSKVNSMYEVFARSRAFNGSLAGWEPGAALANGCDLGGMFRETEVFNQDLSSWDVSKATNMYGMFEEAKVFNGSLVGWQPGVALLGGCDLGAMFREAEAFDQSLGSWDIAKASTLYQMLHYSGLSAANYDATLIGWAAQENIPVDMNLGAESLTYCAGADARQQLIDDFSWTINDAGEADDCDGGGIGPADPNYFITIWKTDNDGTSGDDQITIPTTGEFTYTWVDTNNPASTGSGNGNDGTTITFPRAGTYEVRIAPTGSTPFNDIFFGAFVAGDKLKLLEIKNWGAIHWSEFAFGGCANLTVTATDIPDLTGVTDLSFAFSYSGIDEIPNFNDWDVSNVTNMGNLFEQATNFNQSLDRWDVSNVTDMTFMFDGATSFNQPLDSWDVRKLEHFSYMFRDASSFNQSLGAWKLESLLGAVAAFFRSGMSCENYSYTLYGWATHPNTNEDVIFGLNEIPYSPDVAPYRDFLTDNLNWDFQGNDGVGTCSVTLPSTPVTPGPDNILYVDQNVSGGNGSGDSWENAIPELADALKWAREQHDGGSPSWTEMDPLRIFVAKGTYLPLYHAADGQYTTDGGRDNSFVLVPNVQLYGGFDPLAGIETLEDARILPDMNRPEQGSILSGDFNGDDRTDNYDNHTENAHHVTIASGNVGSAFMDGFTVTGGYARGNTSGPSVMGRTIYRFFGGGTYVISSSPQFTHMAWFNNLGDWGGGLFNTVSLLTEISSPKLSNVTFYRNMAPGGGGGIRNFGGSVDIKQAIFANNGAGLVEDGTSSGPGGGIHSSGNGTSLSVTNATFYGNWIVGVFIPEFDGGAIYVEQTSTLLNNVVIWENEVEGDPTDPSASISVSTLGGDVTVANSLVAHTGGSANWNPAMGILDGGNNIDADPVFVSTTPGEVGYLQLSASSPAINGGSNTAYTDAGGDLATDIDLAGNPRVYNLTGGGVIDMGAYEYPGEPIPEVTQLAALDAVETAYGTAFNAIGGLPAMVTATLSDNTDVTVPLDGNLDNWTLVSPAGGSYNGNVAGTYVFAVPLVLPEAGDEPYFTNPDGLRAEVTIIVTKGIPALAVSWDGEDIDMDEGLSLTYGDIGKLVFGTTDPAGVIIYAFGDEDPPVLDLADLAAVAAQQAGMATLTIAQEETDNYEAASVKVAVRVAPRTITIIPTTNQGKIYGADDPTFYGFALVDGDALAFDDELADIVSAASREAGENVGSYDINLEFAGEQVLNYSITFETDNNVFRITPLQITVTAENQAKTFGTDDPELTYTFTPGLVGHDEFSGDLDREEGEGVGTYAIARGDLSLGDNYEIVFEEGALTITPAGYEGIEFKDASFVYDGTEHALELTGELPEGVVLSYDIVGEPGNGATYAGTYEVTAHINGGANYEDVELTAILTIIPLEISIRAEDQSKVFGSDDPGLTYTYTPELIGSDKFTGRLNRDQGEEVGTYPITQGNLSLNDNYEIVFKAGTLTIMPAGYGNVELNDLTVTYDGMEHVLELTGELPEGVTVIYEIDGEAGNGAIDAGIYKVAAQIDGGDNYGDGLLSATLTITPLEITVRAADQSKVFGADDPELTYTVSPELIGEDVFTGELAREPGEDVGSYAITRGDLSVGDNYRIVFENGTMAIIPAAYNGIDFTSETFTYDGTKHRLTLTGKLPVGGSVRYENNGRMDAGSQQVTAVINGGTNYEDTVLTATLTVLPLPMRVTAEGQSKAVGMDDPVLTYTFTPALIGGDSFTGTLTRESGEEAGTYAIMQGTLSAGSNYGITFIGADLTITQPLPTEITGMVFTGRRFVYDGLEHTLSVTGELPEGASVRYENNGRINAGSQQVTATIEGEGYETLVLTATLTIAPAERTIIFPELAEKVYGDDDFDGRAMASSEERIIYTTGDATVAAIVEGRIRIVGAGETILTATVPENGNYTSKPTASRRLTVRKATQTIRLDAPEEVDRDGGSIYLTASSTSGLPVNLAIDDEQVATLEGETLNIQRLGTVTITATQPGDANHEAADPVIRTIRVVDPSADLPIRVHPVVSPNGDGINEFLMVEAIGDYPENRMTIFNRNGTLLWEAGGYDNNRVAFRGISTGQLLLQAGTYFYIVEVKVDGIWKNKKGWFVLRY
ncbi:BspA family leucine-rich repeat surface protein [Parapedobacter defluvii]|nr:BspA family leucine-rich repeat surface protein [Parapedobacter defluvii]